jgi:SEC-C motif-containing protein
MSNLLCLCGSQLAYSLCCQPFHENKQRPLTAEALMRSRFTAYAKLNKTYLLDTWIADKRPEEINFSKEDVEWTKLEIVDIKKGGAKDSKGIVEFKAYYMQEDEEYAMNEISRFKKVAGKWFYMDGLVKSIKKANLQTNQGKNAPCSCGSGKKFKRCCGK